MIWLHKTAEFVSNLHINRKALVLKEAFATADTPKIIGQNQNDCSTYTIA